MLLYSDDTVAVRFVLVVRLSTTSEPSWRNPLLNTLCDVADVSFTLYVIISVLLAIQVNSTVVPSIAATETGSTRKTKMKARIQTPPGYNPSSINIGNEMCPSLAGRVATIHMPELSINSCPAAMLLTSASFHISRAAILLNPPLSHPSTQSPCN